MREFFTEEELEDMEWRKLYWNQLIFQAIFIMEDFIETIKAIGGEKK